MSGPVDPATPGARARAMRRAGAGLQAIAAALRLPYREIERALAGGEPEAEKRAPAPPRDRRRAPPITDEQARTIRAMTAEGAAAARIAARIGVTPQRVLDWRSVNGVLAAPRPGPISPDEKARIVAMTAAGMFTHDIAVALGRSPNALPTWCRVHGVPVRLKPRSARRGSWAQKREASRGASVPDLAPASPARSSSLAADSEMDAPVPAGPMDGGTFATDAPERPPPA